MNKKKLVTLIAGIVLILGILAGCGASDTETTSEEPATTQSAGNGKALVVYYSAQGHTENIAKAIADEIDADTFVITPVDEYTEDDLNYNDDSSRVSKEYADESLRDIALESTEVDNWDSYDTVYIGYPIWWGIAAWPVDNFVKDNDFTGKTVIPFCTAFSSDIGQSGELLAEMAGTGDWQEGQRFQQDEDVESAREWVRSLNK